MAQHTPGIWQEVELPDCMLVVGGSDDVYPLGICHTTDDTPFEEQEANARLIAAAPDLYAAAKRIADKILYNGDCYGEDEAALIQAVKKAEGQL